MDVGRQLLRFGDRGMLRHRVRQAYNVEVGYNWRKVPEELERKGIKIDETLKKLILAFGELRYVSGRGVGYHAGIAWANENTARKYRELAWKTYKEVF